MNRSRPEDTALRVSRCVFVDQVQNEDALNRRLYQEAFLTFRQFEEMYLPVCTREKKLRQIISALEEFISTPGVFTRFLNILRQTGNAKVASVMADNLQAPGPRNALQPDFAPLQKKALRTSCWLFLQRTRNEESLIRRLYEQGCLRRDHFERIQLSTNTRTDKLFQILRHVAGETGREAGVFTTFLNILTETGNGELASALSNDCRPYSKNDTREADLSEARLQKEALRRSCVVFVRETHDVQLVIRRLFQRGSFTTGQLENLQLPIYTRIDKLCQMLFLLSRALARVGVFQDILATLKETGNANVASTILDNYHRAF